MAEPTPEHRPSWRKRWLALLLPVDSPTARRIFRKALLIGSAITLLCIVAQGLGLTDPIEGVLYDHRARAFQQFAPAASDELVQVEIDDGAIARIGRWPWSRSVIAGMLETLHDAGVRAVAMDILFTEPQPQGAGTDHDARLADAVGRSGAILAASFAPQTAQRTPIERELLDILLTSVSTEFTDAEGELRRRGVLAGHVALEVDSYIVMRRTAIRQRLAALTIEQLADEAHVAGLLLPHDPPNVITPARQLLREELSRHRAAAALLGLSRPLRPEEAGLLRVRLHSPPVLALAARAGGSGLVDYFADEEVIRSTPLAVDAEGVLQLPLGAALACRHMGIAPADVRLEPTAGLAVLNRTDGQRINVPVFSRHLSGGQSSAGIMLVPWHGKADTRHDWRVMFDPEGRRELGRVSAREVWEVDRLRQSLAANAAAADTEIPYLLALLITPARGEAYRQLLPLPADDTRRDEAVARILQIVRGDELWRSVLVDPVAEGQLDEAALLSRRRYADLELLERETVLLRRQLQAARDDLRRRLSGRSVLIGLTATGALDIRNTPLHAGAPGVLFHASLFNALVNREFWHKAPLWADLLCTLVLGLLASLGVARARALGGMLIAAGLAAAWYLLNGSLLFDYGNWVVEVSPPLLAIGMSFAAGTVFRYAVEAAERGRITRRFRSYVDPNLVRYVIEHPEQARLAGEVRELTVVFTDLAGFTTLSQKLQERTVPILSLYLSRMVPIIRAHHGLLNKFLGDGIMFFHGAPEPRDTHALDAVRAVLLMQREMESFNQYLRERDLPLLAMRVGLSTGPMVVGDAGPAEACDYTVLGDMVNLASRLEGANKATGTRILMTERTVELVGQQFICRPVASLQVVGRAGGVKVYEPLAPVDETDEQLRQRVELTANMVQAFWRGDFATCRAAAAVLVERFAADQKLAALYERACAAAERADKADFTGVIELTEK